MAEKEKKTKIIVQHNLQGYFYDKLQELNQRATRPLPDEAIFYSSSVMDEFGESSKYFEIEAGKVKEKVLGLKFLESGGLSGRAQSRRLKEVGDTALFLCGYFSESLNRKIVDTSYYHDLGRMAYKRLNTIMPNALEVPSFFEMLADYFESVTHMMALVSKQSFGNSSLDQPFFLSVDPDNLKVS